MQFRPDTSFPFLKIARAWGVDYGEVIRTAEHFWSGSYRITLHARSWLSDTQEAVFAERRRRGEAVL